MREKIGKLSNRSGNLFNLLQLIYKDLDEGTDAIDSPVVGALDIAVSECLDISLRLSELADEGSNENSAPPSR